jgi:hypothetical protein
MPEYDHRALNYKPCTALDLTRLGVTCDELIAHGADPTRVKSLFLLSKEVLSLFRGVNDELEKE